MSSFMKGANFSYFALGVMSENIIIKGQYFPSRSFPSMYSKYTLIWMWMYLAVLYSYNSFHSSGKAFHKILDCFCTNFCPFIQ